MAAMATVLKVYFELFPFKNLKVKSTQNSVGSIGVTCRSKIAKIFQSEIQDAGHHENVF